ncbi:MAG: HDOD domain-containing protein [Betaproteobacteria bacterium]|nr:HDOD domain-containing protein [Betaproteobacteria bacterium]
MTTLTRETAEKLVASIGIPPRPAAVIAVQDEKAKADPNLKVIADAIARDVGLSAALLKTVNSALFGLPRQVQSVPHAVNLLGVARVSTLVNSLALKTSLNTFGIERFWDQSTRTALLCGWLAGKMGHDRDLAHLFGLFRDAGIPLMMKRFPDYKDTLRLANQPGADFAAIEDARHGVSHAQVGAIMARNWNLPGVIRDAIAHHHEPALFDDAKADLLERSLVALSHLAGVLEARHSRHQDDSEWVRFANPVLSLLMVGDEDLDELAAEASSLLLDTGL